MNIAHRLHLGAQAALVLVFFAFPVSVALANLALLLTLLLWLLSLSGAPARHALMTALRNPLVAPALALFAWIVIALAWSPADPAAQGSAVQKYLKLAMVPAFIALLQDPRVRRRCWQAFALALLLTLALTWLNVWFDLPFTRTHNQGFGADHTVFKDYISQGMMMSWFALLCVFAALAPGRRAWPGLGVWALASVSILLLSQGRTGYLTWAASTAVFVVTLAAARSGRLLLAAVLALAAMFATVVAVSPVLQERGEQALAEATHTGQGPITSIGARLEMAEMVIARAPDAPWLGHGTASYPVHAAAHFTAPGYCEVVCPHPHNQFLFFLFEQGAIGLLLFLWLIAAIARAAWREEPRRRALGLAWVAIVCAACVSHSSLWLSTENHFIVFMSALLMASLQARRAKASG